MSKYKGKSRNEWLLPSTCYNGDLMYFYILQKCLFTTVYFAHPITNNIQIGTFWSFKVLETFVWNAWKSLKLHEFFSLRGCTNWNE